MSACITYSIYSVHFIIRNITYVCVWFTLPPGNVLPITNWNLFSESVKTNLFLRDYSRIHQTIIQVNKVDLFFNSSLLIGDFHTKGQFTRCVSTGPVNLWKRNCVSVILAQTMNFATMNTSMRFRARARSAIQRIHHAKVSDRQLRATRPEISKWTTI